MGNARHVSAAPRGGGKDDPPKAFLARAQSERDGGAKQTRDDQPSEMDGGQVSPFHHPFGLGHAAAGPGHCDHCHHHRRARACSEVTGARLELLTRGIYSAS